MSAAVNYLPGKIEETSAVFSQEPDSCSNFDGSNELKVQAVDAGDGHYLILSTHRWALNPDEIDAFAAYLHRFIQQTERGNK